MGYEPLCEPLFNTSVYELIGNKAKGRISKWLLQENRARQIFRKTNISYPLIRTLTCAYHVGRNIRFSEIWHVTSL